jgi:membrane protease YdiL (CAAX protease family)
MLLCAMRNGPPLELDTCMTIILNQALKPHERFARLEDAGSDFPFYNGVPVSISTGQWLLVMLAVVLGFLALALPIDWPGGSTLAQLIPAVLMPGLPIMALAYVAPGHWHAIFGKVGGREIRLMVGFALLNILVSMTVGAIVQAFTSVTPNASTAELAHLDAAGVAAFFAKTIPQLFGEEVITLLPFLAIMQLFSRGFGVGRKQALVAAWLLTALMFGLVHLPTYGWNWIQCIVIIGSARLMLTLPWLLTKNIWVCTGAHIMNDWLLFSMSLLGASLVGKT